MSNSDDDMLVTQRLWTMRMILVALMAGCLAFLTIAVVLRQGGHFAQPPAMPIFTYVALGFAIFWTPISFIIPDFFVTAERGKMAKASERYLNDPQASLPASDMAKLLGLYATRMIISSAILEGCIFLFLIVYMLEGSPYCLVGALVLLGIITTKFPNRSSMERWLEQQRELLQQERTGM